MMACMSTNRNRMRLLFKETIAAIANLPRCNARYTLGFNDLT
jgi:hypothetical protein